MRAGQGTPFDQARARPKRAHQRPETRVGQLLRSITAGTRPGPDARGELARAYGEGIPCPR